MSFLEELRSFLSQVAKAPEGLIVMPAFIIDEAALRRHLIEALERLEQSPGVGADRVSNLHELWTKHDRAVRFARRLASALRDGIAHKASAQEIQHMVHISIGRQLGLDDSAGSLARNLELDRLTAECNRSSFMLGGTSPDSLLLVRAYAHDVRAVRGVDQVRLSPVGQVALELNGKDMVRWLLHVEVETSLGIRDERRLSKEAAQALLDAPTRSWYYQDPNDGPPCPQGTLRRLSSMTLLSLTSDPGDPELEGYALTATGEELFKELVGENATLFRVLAQALSKDETHQALNGQQPPTLAMALQASSAESVALQARLVAHEMTNALGPARVALDQLSAAVAHSPGPPRLGPFCERIEVGFKRAFRFLEELKATATLADARDSFEVDEALRQAIDEVAGTLPIHLKVVHPVPPLRGYRERFVLAMRDLLRNAQHAAPGDSGRIQLSARLDGTHVEVLIDDNGPGVPVELRQAVFADGFTLRPGGSGQGLALLKQVVEVELRGTVACEDSPLGGARFHVRLPLFPGELS